MEDSFIGYVNKSSSEAVGKIKPEEKLCSSVCPELPCRSSSEGSAENFDELRMKLVACFCILLPKEDPFKVIPKGKDHDAHQEHEACLLCDFSLALSEGFPEDALNQEK